MFKWHFYILTITLTEIGSASQHAYLLSQAGLPKQGLITIINHNHNSLLNTLRERRPCCFSQPSCTFWARKAKLQDLSDTKPTQKSGKSHTGLSSTPEALTCLMLLIKLSEQETIFQVSIAIGYQLVINPAFGITPGPLALLFPSAAHTNTCMALMILHRYLCWNPLPLHHFFSPHSLKRALQLVDRFLVLPNRFIRKHF